MVCGRVSHQIHCVNIIIALDQIHGVFSVNLKKVAHNLESRPPFFEATPADIAGSQWYQSPTQFTRIKNHMCFSGESNCWGFETNQNRFCIQARKHHSPKQSTPIFCWLINHICFSGNFKCLDFHPAVIWINFQPIIPSLQPRKKYRSPRNG